MVQIEEVADDAWSDASSTSSHDEKDDDASSIASDLADLDDTFDPSSETLSDRLYALKDMIKPSTRSSISSTLNQITGYGWIVAGLGGKMAWVTCTSAILVGLPLMLAIEGEAGLIQQEQQYLGAQAAQGANTQGTSPTQNGQIVPPGF